MTARLLVGDVHDRLTELEDGTVDLILTSPPFLALRKYLPAGHPDEAKEIGSEPTPAVYLDVLLQLTAEWGRVLAPHGSIAVELGDTYAGSGGAGGDYDPDGLRDGQPAFDGSARRNRPTKGIPGVVSPGGTVGTKSVATKGDGWPLAKSLACIPQLYQVALAYGLNPLTGQPSPAGRWRVRTLKAWCRSNPPVGALGDKERPATSYVIVACRAMDRWFDLDAVRTPPTAKPQRYLSQNDLRRGRTPTEQRGPGELGALTSDKVMHRADPGGAPPRDWWHHVDAILDTVKDEMPEARGVHYRRALEDAGILTTLEALDVSPRGYSGAHYAVWPPELCRLLIDEMCPRQVCTICGEPRRRITERSERYAAAREAIGDFNQRGSGQGTSGSRSVLSKAAGADITSAENITVGWSDCGCLPQSPVGEGTESGETGSARPTDHTEPWPPTSPTPGRWRPGHILDPFAGSGTTLAVATGMGRTATGIDIDERNALLALERVGMFLDIDYPTRTAS